MGKMGQELDKRLEENKYEMWEVLKYLVAWDAANDDAELISNACSYARLALAQADKEE